MSRRYIVKVRDQIRVASALAVSALVIAGSAGAGSQLGDYRDAPERAAAASGLEAIAYPDAIERAILVQSATTGMPAEYVDSHERGAPVVGTSAVPGKFDNGDSGFDWSAALVGASSALMLAVLIGVSLMVVRGTRGGPLTR